MASARLSLLGLAVFAPTRAAAGLALAADNDMSAFRSEPALFLSDWARPAPIAAARGAGREKQLTDLALHGAEAEEEPLLLSLLYPSSWERHWEGPAATNFCRRWWWVSYVAAGLYLAGLSLGEGAMKQRQAFHLKRPLALWNLFLAVFSFIGALRTMPHLLMLLHSYGWEYTVCRAAASSYGSGAAGFWVCLFVFSKYFELIDTVFMVLRKKQVPFLHWYHHFTVLLYCWHAYVWEMPTGIYFAAMNYSVHAIMYFYYFLAAVCAKPPKWAMTVTVLQLTQMVVGVAVTLSHIRMLVAGSPLHCDGHLPNLAAAAGMYASYFYLFAAFFVGRFCRKQDPAAKAVKKGRDLPKLD